MSQTTYRLSVNLGDSNANSGNINGSFNNNFYTSDEDAQIMRWISPLEPNNRHQSVRTDRFKGVGGWLLETSEFREWREGGADKAVLFSSGNPGAGKTYLSSLVIDSLYDQEGKADATIAYLYCDYLSQQEQSVTNMMGAILRQLVGGGGIPNYLREKFLTAKNKFGGRGLLLPDLMGMLRIAIASLHQVFICVDALDEFLPKDLPDLLMSLGDIVQEFPRARIFLTGRPHVKEDIQSYFTKAVVIPVCPDTDDIRNYVEMRLNKDTVRGAMNDRLRADIVRIILEKISDIFLLVSLNMDGILGEVTISRRRKKLEEMTRGNGLGDAYTATLTRLKAQKGYKSAFGLKVLMWVIYSERPLRAKELCHAMGVEMGSAELDVENVPSVETLVASSLGLVTVEASSSTVRLVHFTLKEHLSSDPALFPSPHSTIAEVCLTYLNFGSVRDLSPILYRVPSTMPLLEYASHHWSDHTRTEMTENTKILALKLLDRFDEHISSQLLLSHYSRNTHSPPFYYSLGVRTRFTGLHAAAFLGIAGIVDSILKMKEWDVDAIDCCGSTALTWAAIRGHEGVVKMLLERAEVNPNQADTEYGQTPLSWAAESGHEGVVKMLLERSEVHPNQADADYGRTPLSWAAGHGHEVVVMMLLSRDDVRTDTPDNQGQTPLLLALSKGHHEVARILRERDNINSDAADLSGQPSILPPAGPVDEPVVEMQSRSDSPHTDITDLNDQPALPSSADPGEQDGISDINNPVSKSPDNDPPLTVRPTHSQPPLAPPVGPRYPPSQTGILLNNTPSTLSIAVALYFVIASSVCLLAFLVYVVPSLLPDIFLFHKYRSY